MTAKYLRYSLFSLLAILATLPRMAQAQNYSDIWWNPAESGWGLTIADHQSQLFAVWFTYRQDGMPAWYVIPGGTFTNGHQHFQGDIYATTGPAYSAATFDSSRVTATKVGTATIDFSSFGAATFTYSLAGVTQTKAIQRQPFGNATPMWGGDVTDIWWNPNESGWGLTLAQHGNNVFGVWFTYDTDGQPLWAVIPGVTFNGNAFTGALYTTTGPYFASVPFDSSKVVATQEGSATFSWSKSSPSSQCGGDKAATYQTTLRGASRQSPACQQPFGSAAALPVFPNATARPDGAALFTAPANPINATITTSDARKVSQVITSAGGTMSVTDNGGNSFTLDFPPNAVMDDTAVTMTPIATVSGPNYASGTAFGLKLEPDGLVLQDNAILTLVPAQPFPDKYQTGFAADGDGKNLHGAPPGPDFSRIQLDVAHFSFWGWLFMSPEERAAEKRMAQAEQAEARIMDAVSGYVRGLKQSMTAGTIDSADPPPSAQQIGVWMEEYYRDVVTPRLQSASVSCANAVSAFNTLNTLMRIRASEGTFDEIPNYVTDLDTVRQAFGKLVSKTPCYFEEAAKFVTIGGTGFVTTTITAKWQASAQSGNVITYVPFTGHLDVDYPITPPCVVTNPVHGVGRNDGQMSVDWDARTYTGAAMHNTTLNIICPPPDASSVDTPFPVMYLGNLGNFPTGTVSGQMNASNGITEESQSFGPMVVTYSFSAGCSGANGIFCGR